jgi:hypothetical protein
MVSWTIRNFVTWIWVALPVWINASSKQAQDDPKWMVGLILAGLAAPLCFHYAPHLWRSRKRGIAVLAVLMGIGGMSVSVWTAIDVVGSHRQSQKAPVQAKIDEKERLLRKDADLLADITKLGFVSGGQDAIVLSRDIDSMKLKQVPGNPNSTFFGRIKGCTIPTVGGSLTFCDDLRQAQAKLAAAEKIEKIEAERKELQGKLERVSDAPETADPRGDFIAAFFSIDQKKLDLGWQGWTAMLFELMAIFMPLIMGEALPKPARHRDENEVSPKMPTLAATPIATRLQIELATPATPALPTPCDTSVADTATPKIADMRDTQEIVAQQQVLGVATPRKSPRATPAPTPAPRGVARTSDTRRDATPADVAIWAGERLLDRTGHETRGGVLLHDFGVWCDERGLIVLSKDKFGPALEALGYGKVRKKNVMYQNVVLKASQPMELSVIEGGRA